MSVSDNEILNYFRVLTDISDQELDSIEEKIKKGENPMIFKKRLALEITKWLHNDKLAKEAEAHFEKTVQGDNLPDKIPEIKIKTRQISLLELCQKAKSKESKSNLRRLISQGAVSVNGEKMIDDKDVLKIKSGGILQIGKRNYFKLLVKSPNSR